MGTKMEKKNTKKVEFRQETAYFSNVICTCISHTAEVRRHSVAFVRAGCRALGHTHRKSAKRKNNGSGDFSSNYSPYLESYLLPS